MDGIKVRAPEGFYDCRIKVGQKLNLAGEKKIKLIVPKSKPIKRNFNL